MSKRILITGSRDWDNEPILWGAMEQEWVNGCTYIVGDCPTGADHLAYDYWQKMLANSSFLEKYYAKWFQHGRAAGPLRNQEMVDTGADICLAFRKNNSRGTRDCIIRAEAADIPIRLWEC